MFTVVHAQISSTSRVLRSAWTVVSRGDCIFPCRVINLLPSQTQQEQLPETAEAVFLGPLAAVCATASFSYHEFVQSWARRDLHNQMETQARRLANGWRATTWPVGYGGAGAVTLSMMLAAIVANPKKPMATATKNPAAPRSSQ